MRRRRTVFSVVLSGTAAAALHVDSPVGSAADCNGNGVDDRRDIAADSRFAAGRNFSLEERPHSVTLVDLNADGRSDLIALGSDGVSVLMSNDDGAFDPSRYTPAPGYPRDVTATDYDADGDVDLAMVASDGLSMLRNNGSGRIGEPSLVSADFVSAHAITSADVDADGATEFIVADFGIFDDEDEDRCVDGDVSILFIEPPDGQVSNSVSVLPGGHPETVISADLDGDGDPDLAVGRDDGLFFLFNSGDGTFGTAADLNGDSHLDLAVGRGGGIALLQGTGDGAFSASLGFTTGGFNVNVVVADLDGDEDFDLATAGGSNDTVWVLFNETIPPRSPDGNRNGVPDECEGDLFRRGDVNADGKTNISDALRLLDHLFRDAGGPPCQKSADADDDGQLEIADAIVLLRFLFLAGPAPPEPFTRCGLDPTPDPLACESYPECPD